MVRIQAHEEGVQTLLHKFREILLAVERESDDLSRRRSSVRDTNNNHHHLKHHHQHQDILTSSEESSGLSHLAARLSQRVINNLTSNSDTNATSNSVSTTRTSSTSSSSCHAALLSNNIRTASSTNAPSSTTFTSNLLTGSTTTTDSCARSSSNAKPPSYKTALKPNYNTLGTQTTPLPPLRTKRRRGTLPTVSTHSILTDRAQMSNAKLARGALIVLEGLDRVGKSTLAKKLVEHLERCRKPVAHVRFPDRTTAVGKLINEFLKTDSKQVDDHALHLLFSANRWELNKTIRNTINKGTTVVVDRYSYSGIAYSSAKRTSSLDWCIATENGLPKPDLVIFLELDQDSQYKRDGFGDERFETSEFQERVRGQYEKVIDMSSETWIRVEVNNKSPDQVLGEIVIPVRQCLEACADKELGCLDFS